MDRVETTFAQPVDFSPYPKNLASIYSHPSRSPHTSSQQLAGGNGWPQPPFRQVWRWSDACWVARVAPVVCLLVCSRLPDHRKPMGRARTAEKTPAAHGSASTLLTLKTPLPCAVSHILQWP